ncbi:hypothetical protein HDU97_003655 [Phlyctochytrium planicorne]|nr:hypothetical protein HDU97_003655 [Phlyctochytrium planicorne]
MESTASCPTIKTGGKGSIICDLGTSVPDEIPFNIGLLPSAFAGITALDQFDALVTDRSDDVWMDDVGCGRNATVPVDAAKAAAEDLTPLRYSTSMICALAFKSSCQTPNATNTAIITPPAGMLCRSTCSTFLQTLTTEVASDPNCPSGSSDTVHPTQERSHTDREGRGRRSGLRKWLEWCNGPDTLEGGVCTIAVQAEQSTCGFESTAEKDTYCLSNTIDTCCIAPTASTSAFPPTSSPPLPPSIGALQQNATSNNTAPVANESSSSSVSTVLIIGLSAGAALILIIITALLVWWSRSRRNRKETSVWSMPRGKKRRDAAEDVAEEEEAKDVEAGLASGPVDGTAAGTSAGAGAAEKPSTPKPLSIRSDSSKKLGVIVAGSIISKESIPFSPRELESPSIDAGPQESLLSPAAEPTAITPSSLAPPKTPSTPSSTASKATRNSSSATRTASSRKSSSSISSVPLPSRISSQKPSRGRAFSDAIPPITETSEQPDQAERVSSPALTLKSKVRRFSTGSVAISQTNLWVLDFLVPPSDTVEVRSVATTDEPPAEESGALRVDRHRQRSRSIRRRGGPSVISVKADDSSYIFPQPSEPMPPLPALAKSRSMRRHSIGSSKALLPSPTQLSTTHISPFSAPTSRIQSRRPSLTSLASGKASASGRARPQSTLSNGGKALKKTPSMRSFFSSMSAPSQFVFEPVEIPGMPSFHLAIVMEGFDALEEDEIWLDPGDVVQVHKMFDDGWAFGVNRTTGDFGMFPAVILATL